MTLLLLAAICNSSILAQSVQEMKVDVFQNGVQLISPFAGGLKSPQFSEVDLNGDGIQDLFIFDKAGNMTPFMQNINNLLSTLVKGIIQTEAFINTLSAHNLIEPIQLTVNFTGQAEQRFDGIYTVNEQALKALDSETLFMLNQKGYLQGCYLLLASMGQVQKLIKMKRERL